MGIEVLVMDTLRFNSEKAIKWDLWNRILNNLRKAKNLPLIPNKDNPYRRVDNEGAN